MEEYTCMLPIDTYDGVFYRAVWMRMSGVRASGMGVLGWGVSEVEVLCGVGVLMICQKYVLWYCIYRSIYNL